MLALSSHNARRALALHIRLASTYTRTPWVPQDGVPFSARPGKNGFLPSTRPPRKLPEKFAKVDELLARMRAIQTDGSPGLLAKGTFGGAVRQELPLIDITEEDMSDPALLAGLFRDYGVLGAAYALEPTHVAYQKTGQYAHARTLMPANLSEPLHKLAARLGANPWLDYNYGLVVYNATCADGRDGLTWDDWSCVRMFTGMKSEEAFITVHHSIIALSGDLMKFQLEVLDAVAASDAASVARGLNSHAATLRRIVEALQRMWHASNPADFLTFRTFQFGQTGNADIFPQEKIYYEMADGSIREGSYRGETGAMDSCVPSVDNLLGLEYPRNKLTEYLFDLRRYRPTDHQRYLNWLLKESRGLDLRGFAMTDARCSVALMRNLEYLRQMRRGHWKMVKAYILKNLDEYAHPVGTGGSPITTWLPNNLGATLEYQKFVVEAVNRMDARGVGPVGKDRETFIDLSSKLNQHVLQITEEVMAMQPSFKNQDQMVSEFEHRDTKLSAQVMAPSG